MGAVLGQRQPDVALLPRRKCLPQAVALAVFLQFRVLDRAGRCPDSHIALVQRPASVIIELPGLAGAVQAPQDLVDLLPPQPQRGADLPLVRLAVPHLELPGIRLVLLPQFQDPVSVLQLPQRQPDAVLRVLLPLRQLPEIDLLPVDPVLLPLEVRLPLLRLALQTFAGRQQL